MQQIVTEACSSAPEFEITGHLPIENQVQKLATGFRNAKDEAAQSHWEISVQIVKLKLLTHPVMPPKIMEKCKNIITITREIITRTMKECIDFFTELIFTLTTLQEDPTLQHLEIEVQEL